MGAEVEQLTQTFDSDYFDVVHTTNSLDHAHNPMRGMEEMLRVVRPGRPILLRVWRNTGLLEHYAGLHQWNLDLRDWRFALWRPRSVQNPSEGEEVIDVEERLLALGLIEPGAVETRM